MTKQRAELQSEVAEALISSKAINFEAVGTVLAKFGARAAVTGVPIGVIIGRHVIDACIPVDFRDLLGGIEINRTIQE